MSALTEKMLTALEQKKQDRFDKLRKEFSTCRYSDSGAYNPIPTERGNLKEKVVPKYLLDHDPGCSLYSGVPSCDCSYEDEESRK